jgi:cytochrome b involved in lipid metabolism
MGDGDKEFKEEEVATHNTEKDCYLIIGNEDTGGPMVYDVSKYMDDHPGGPEILMEYAGKDADEMFDAIGHSKEAKSKMKEMLVGKLYVRKPMSMQYTVCVSINIFTRRSQRSSNLNVCMYMKIS